MRWPWQRSNSPAPSGTQDLPAPVSPAGWAFLPPLQRTLGSIELTTRPETFPHELPAWRNPSFTGTLTHLVSRDAPSGVIDGDGAGHPATVAGGPELSLAIAPRSTPVQRSAATATPVRSTPAGAMPDGTMPAGTMPAGTMPAGTMPAGTMPAETMRAPFTTARVADLPVLHVEPEPDNAQVEPDNAQVEPDNAQREPDDAHPEPVRPFEAMTTAMDAPPAMPLPAMPLPAMPAAESQPADATYVDIPSAPVQRSDDVSRDSVGSAIPQVPTATRRLGIGAPLPPASRQPTTPLPPVQRDVAAPTPSASVPPSVVRADPPVMPTTTTPAMEPEAAPFLIDADFRNDSAPASDAVLANDTVPFATDLQLPNDTAPPIDPAPDAVVTPEPGRVDEPPMPLLQRVTPAAQSEPAPTASSTEPPQTVEPDDESPLLGADPVAAPAMAAASSTVGEAAQPSQTVAPPLALSRAHSDHGVAETADRGPEDTTLAGDDASSPVSLGRATSSPTVDGPTLSPTPTILQRALGLHAPSRPPWRSDRMAAPVRLQPATAVEVAVVEPTAVEGRAVEAAVVEATVVESTVQRAVGGAPNPYGDEVRRQATAVPSAIMHVATMPPAARDARSLTRAQSFTRAESPILQRHLDQALVASGLPTPPATAPLMPVAQRAATAVERNDLRDAHPVEGTEPQRPETAPESAALQRAEIADAPSSGGTTHSAISLAPAAPASGTSPEQIEELARRLVGPLTRRLSAQMLLDRERRGYRTDLR
jgi:hypothetical protein